MKVMTLMRTLVFRATPFLERGISDKKDCLCLTVSKESMSLRSKMLFDYSEFQS